MVRKFAKGFTYVAFTSTVLVSGLMMAPGQAHADNDRCPTNRFCLFQQNNFGGGRATFTDDDLDLSNNRYDNGGMVNDTASSMINNTGHNVTLYKDTNKRNAVYIAQKESEDSTFDNNGSQNNVSSLDFN
jgi:hypothetical protein